MNNRRKTPTSVTTVVLTLITVLVWAGFEVYRALTVKPAPPVPPEISRPLDPTLDKGVLNQLGQKLFIQDSEIGNFEATGATTSPVSTTTSTPAATATASATPVASSLPTPTSTATPTPTPSP